VKFITLLKQYCAMVKPHVRANTLKVLVQCEAPSDVLADVIDKTIKKDYPKAKYFLKSTSRMIMVGFK
jgi:hypothetical protein